MCLKFLLCPPVPLIVVIFLDFFQKPSAFLLKGKVHQDYCFLDCFFVLNENKISFILFMINFPMNLCLISSCFISLIFHVCWTVLAAESLDFNSMVLMLFLWWESLLIDMMGMWEKNFQFCAEIIYFHVQNFSLDKYCPWQLCR